MVFLPLALWCFTAHTPVRSKVDEIKKLYNAVVPLSINKGLNHIFGCVCV